MAYTNPEYIQHRRELQRVWYQKNRERILAKLRANPAKQRKNNKNFTKSLKVLIELHRTKCKRCGMDDKRCLEFHHKDPTTKETLITPNIQNKKRLLREINKCIILCANCHKIVHTEMEEVPNE